MNKIGYMTAAAAMIAAFLTSAFGAPKSNNQSPSKAVQASFARIEGHFAEISDRAFKLRELAMDVDDRAKQIEGLQILKEDIRQAGREIQTLEAGRSSLADWQNKALSEIAPMSAEVAGNVSSAIHSFNTNQSRLRTGAYMTDTDKVSREAEAIAGLLSNKLKIAKALDKDQRLERNVAEHAGF